MRTPSNGKSASRYTLRPDTANLLQVSTLPYGRCRLRLEGAEKASGPIVAANHDGLLDLHVRGTGEGTVRLEIDAETPDRTSHQVIDLRVDTEPTEDWPPLPAPRRWRPPPDARIRPPLDRDEALRLDPAVLVERGYPVRPDPEQAPGPFSTWLQTVSARWILVGGPVTSGFTRKPLPDPPSPEDLHTESDNWSGIVVFVDIDGSFSFVSGDWQVPTVATGPFSQDPFLRARDTWSAAWVGIDGHLAPLMQAGTDQMNEAFFLHGSFTFSMSAYFGWQEAFPEDPVSFLPDVPVSPGDQMSCQVYRADPGGLPSVTGSHVFFVLTNVTRGVSGAGVRDLTGSLSNFHCRQVDWIMERPGIPSTQLANYGSMRMTNAFALRADGTIVQYPFADHQTTTMVHAGEVLSTVTPIDPGTMRFDWHAGG